MTLEIEIDKGERNQPLNKFVAESDRDWFVNYCERQGFHPAGLFRRMRVAFEQSLESGSVSGGINGVKTQPGRNVSNPTPPT